MPLQPGDRIERYVIDAMLGHGGMGEVYRAHDERLQRSVALKILHADGGGSQGESTDGAARMLREARAAAALDHPNVVAIYDVGQVQEPEALRGTTYLAMELIKGSPLRAFVGDARVSPREKVRWLTDVARALAAAHAAGLVHRDVKPENVMIRDDGRVKVLDFGIAKRAASDTADATSSTEGYVVSAITGQGVVVGTPLYMAPEQLRAEALDGRADQFAWGVVAYELLTGKPPWSTEGGSIALVAQILSAEPPALSVDANAPAGVADVVMRALSKERAARFPTMEALLEALAQPASAYAETEMIASGDTERSASSAGARAKRAIALAALVAAGLTAVALGLRARMARAPASSSAAPLAAPNRRLAFEVVFDRSPDPRIAKSYAAAMQAARDASLDSARVNLKQALDVDPSFAPANLAYLRMGFAINDAARQHYWQAYQKRDALDARERVILEALEPLVRAEPDTAESARRFRAALAKTPEDGELRFQLARALWFDGDLRGAIDSLRDIAKHDDALALAWADIGFEEEWLGEKQSAIDAYRRCNAIAPSAAMCLLKLGALEAREGQCAEAEQLDRQAIAVASETPAPYEQLAMALEAGGAAEEAVRAAAGQGIRRLPVASQDEANALLDVRLAILAGDFDRVLAANRDLEAANAKRSDAFSHFASVEFGADALIEIGRTADAKRVIEGYLSRVSAWSADSYVVDLTFEAEGMLYRISALSRDDLRARRDAWLATMAGMHQLAPWVQAQQRWWFAYAKATLTPDDAREALDSRARFPSLIAAPARDASYDAVTGDVYRLAGRPQEALPFFRRSAASCTRMMQPFLYVWALEGHAEALADMGDRTGSCNAFERVVALWGHARPRSKTADEARQRMSALGCK